MALSFLQPQLALRLSLLAQHMASSPLVPAPRTVTDAVEEARVAFAPLSPSSSSLVTPTQHLERFDDVARSLSTRILSYVDMHRDPLVEIRARPVGYAAASWAESPVHPWLDGLQMRSAALRVVASSSLQARTTVRSFDLVKLVRDSTAEIAAFCVEKYGVAPAVNVHVATTTTSSSSSSSSSSSPSPSSPVAPMLGVPDFARFAYTELLKNAMRAMLDRYTTAGVDDAPPIAVTVAYAGGRVSVRVDDVGAGLRGWGAGSGQEAAAGAVTRFPYFTSTAAGREQPNYQYSREFGVPFTGHGLGLVRARLFAVLHGGGLAVLSQPGAGTSALLWFDRGGTAMTDVQAVKAVEEGRA
jgi:signal transduction histidine kinase